MHFKSFKKYSKQAQKHRPKVEHHQSATTLVSRNFNFTLPSSLTTESKSLASSSSSLSSAVESFNLTCISKHVHFDNSKNNTRLFKRKDCPQSVHRDFKVKGAEQSNLLFPLKSCLKY
jgi:hypothetical protein